MDSVIEIKRMSDLAETERDIRTEMALVFIDGYYEKLQAITKDKEKLILLFKDSFEESTFYLATMEEKVIGIAACADNKKRAITLDKELFVKHLGMIKGKIVYKALEKEFHGQLTRYEDTSAYIECVATLMEARGKGVATKLMETMVRKAPYKDFKLYVEDTNKGAYSIYKKLGFKEFDRIKATFWEKKFFKAKIYMKIGKLELKNKPPQEQGL